MAHRGNAHKHNLKQRFGMSLEEYDALFEAQHGGCAICGGINPDGRRLSVDHDHETGAIRGLLCHKCNTGIGQLNDSPELVRRALAYLTGVANG